MKGRRFSSCTTKASSWTTPGLDAVGVSGIYRGHDGLRRFFRPWHEAWRGIEYDFDELIDAIRAGKVVRVVWFRSRDEALEAVGLQG